jgi:NitT/TauT family transport system substrate-binding protein
MTPIHIRVLRHSAFYSPLLMTMAGSFLEQEGLRPVYDVATATNTVEGGILAGEVHVAQSAVATGFAGLARGESCPVRHFAQINERDGFFLTRRGSGDAFAWAELVGKTVLVDHFFQPMAMLRYALARAGVAYEGLRVVDAGDVQAIDRAFRAGQGDYVHQQGPYAQQLEADGLGQVVVSVGEVIGPVAFSSLCASEAWLATEMAQAFMRAYRAARHATREWPASEIAQLEHPYFPEIDIEVLTNTVAAYQQLDCWTPSPVITEAAFETALDVFAFSGMIPRRFAYNELCVLPPDELS